MQQRNARLAAGMAAAQNVRIPPIHAIAEKDEVAPSALLNPAL
jgi:hypothetical protein